MNIKRTLPYLLVALALIIFATGCKVPEQLSNADAPDASAPTLEESLGTWEIKNQMEIGHRTTLAGFHNEDFGITVGYGGTVYYTNDGGGVWTESNNDSYCRFGLDIVNENTAWSIGNGGHVRVSTDGGKNWEAVSDLDYKQISESISFLDDRTGWAASPTELWSTSDGGQTWEDVTLPDYSIAIADVTLLAATDGFMLDFAGNLHITHDGGNTWISKASRLCGERIDVFPKPIMRFFDTEKGIIFAKLIGEGLIILRTTDGGETWGREYMPDNIDIDLSGTYLYLSRDGDILTITVPDKNITVLCHKK